MFLEVWSVNDQWAALEWATDQATRCVGCGLDVRETVGPEHVDKWNAELSGHCDGCRAMARATADLSGNDHPDQNAGARFRFWRDQEVVTDGGVGDTGANGSQAEPVGP